MSGTGRFWSTSARGAKVCGALLGHEERGDAGGRHLVSGYAMEDLAGPHVVALWIFCLFVCFPLVVSIQSHCAFFFFFSSVGFWFALQIEFQSATRAARLPHGIPCRDFCLRLKYRRDEKELSILNPVK